MLAVGAILVVVLAAILLTRIAAIALTATGVSTELARFQARSAYTGVGFTTRESESVVEHPARRRIISALMLIGNAGTITVVIMLVIAFLSVGDAGTGLRRVGALAGGLGILWLLAGSDRVDARLRSGIEWGISRFTDLEIRDYRRLLELHGDYEVRELHVDDDHWFGDKTLAEIDPMEHGILVLGVQRADGTYVGAPTSEVTAQTGDHLLLYGDAHAMDELVEAASRRDGAAGDGHASAVDSSST